MPQIYFIKAKDQAGLIKIGHCSDINNRRATLQTGTQAELKVIHWFPCKDKQEALKKEKLLHDTFWYCRRRGEWFTPNVPLRDTIAFLASGGSFEDAIKFAKQVSRKKIRELRIKERCKAKFAKPELEHLAGIKEKTRQHAF